MSSRLICGVDVMELGSIFDVHVILVDWLPDSALSLRVGSPYYLSGYWRH
jgi:hypothetical protein